MINVRRFKRGADNCQKIQTGDPGVHQLDFMEHRSEDELLGSQASVAVGLWPAKVFESWSHPGCIMTAKTRPVAL